jgi:hypothetical protein
MQSVTYQIESQRNLVLPLEPITIAPLGDLQYGSAECDLELFERWLERALAFENVHFLGMGDYVDPDSPSTRMNKRAARRYDSTLDEEDRAADKTLDDLKGILAPTVGKWLGLLRGHHFHEYQSRETTDTKLATFVNAPYLGDCAAVILDLVGRGGRDSREVVMWAAHGSGGASSEGGLINKLDRVATDFDADLFLMAHFHRRFSVPRMRIGWERWGRKHRMIERPIRLVGTGGYLKGYVDGRERLGRPEGTYVEKRLLRPIAQGGLFIHIEPRRNRDGYVEVNYRVEE